jgi:ABC-type phosphate transport system substrate-binding protein
MRTHARHLVFACVTSAASIAGAARSASAQDGFVVIVNAANPVTSLRHTELSKMFLRKQSTWAGGQRVEPVDQIASSVTRRRFSDSVHGMDVPSVKSYWQQIVFSGRGEPPPERTSDADVVAFVQGHVNAIGYIRADTQVVGIRVLTISGRP